jgi:cobalt-zinc-cadmium efflux system outer membrane protein
VFASCDSLAAAALLAKIRVTFGLAKREARYDLVMDMRRLKLSKMITLALVGAVSSIMPIDSHAAEETLTVTQVVELALEANPQVRAARARWLSAQHSIKQNYVPADPQFLFTNGDSAYNPFIKNTWQGFYFTENFQFPGKAQLQANIARGNANIARLTYQAAVRDIRAQAKTAYYQIVLDHALRRLNEENLTALQEVLQVVNVAYSASRATQADFIAAEFNLAAAQQQADTLKVAEQNDRTTLNQVLNRQPDSPLPLQQRLELTPLRAREEDLAARAAYKRQELLEAALAERNSVIALSLAKLEYAPDYTLGYGYDRWILSSAAPAPTFTGTHELFVGFNLPVFFWIRQKEDVKRAGYDLMAAREDLDSVRTQTAAMVAQLYRQAQLAYRIALLYRDSLAPLAEQGLKVALTAYQSGKTDFFTLTNAVQQSNNAKVSYVQAANQFLAGKVALEQAIGEPLEQ